MPITKQSVEPLVLGGAVLLASGGAMAQSYDCDTIRYGTELVDDVTFCASSVLPSSKVATYRPGNLEGGAENLARAWCEGAYGPGKGEWFEFQTRPGTTIRKMVIFNGYQKSKKAFRENGRARDLTIETDSGLQLFVRLGDYMGAQPINLYDWHQVKKIRLTITDVYPGSKYQDLCMSGFGIDFEDIRDHEWQQMNK